MVYEFVHVGVVYAYHFKGNGLDLHVIERGALIELAHTKSELLCEFILN